MRGSRVRGRDALCFEAFVEEWLEFERQRNLSRRARAEVKRYLGDLSRYAGDIDLAGPTELTPEVLQAFVQERGKGLSVSTVKAIVWSVRPPTTTSPPRSSTISCKQGRSR